MFERPEEVRPDDLTVVVVSLVGGAALAACLAALAHQAARTVVVGRGAPGWPKGAEISVPALRLAALLAAKTPYVAFIEDTAVPGPGWRQGLTLALAADGVAAAAGPITISPHLSARGRALGLSEYARFQPNGAEQPKTAALPGLAFAVVRKAVLPLLNNPAEGLVEGDLARRLAEAGQAVRTSNAMAVCYAADHPHGARLRTRFQHGRLFAGRRFPRGFVGRRLGYAAGTVLLPVVMIRRALRGHPKALRAWPGVVLWLCLFSLAWSAGEFTGYLTGSVGDAAESWT
ncbi:MAG: hypothetical protein ACREEY_16595 [Brevundimonas sp.]